MSIARLPIALTIAGSDSGGGAGIQADLKTFAALGVFGTSAVTAVTAQNPAGVSAVQAIDPEVVAGQIRQVLEFFPVCAIKTGMLMSAAIIEAVASALEQSIPSTAAAAPAEGRIPLVLDPVMVATSGARLLEDDAVEALGTRMLPLASLVTPNMDEAVLLSGREVSADTHLEPAAMAIYEKFGVPVLVKGGHLRESEEAIDVFYAGGKAEFFSAPYLRQVNTHGTGCTLSSAIAVYLMRGFPLEDAISEGKNYLHQALAASLPVDQDMVLNHTHSPLPLEMLG